MSLTGPPPPIPAALAAATTGTDPVTGTPTIVGILDARGPDRLTNSISDVLHAASGPGNIITGRVAEIRPDGTVFLATPSGAELSFRHPPEVPIEVGSTITLRLVAIVPAPQAVLLAVDGRSVSGLLARAGNAARQAAADGPAAATALPNSASGSAAIPVRPGSPADLGFGIASALVATLGREAESGPSIIPGSTGAGLTVRTPLAAAKETTDQAATSAPVVAVLVRTAPPRPGVTAPILGTRYLLSVTAVAPPSGEPLPTTTPVTRQPTPPASAPASPVQTPAIAARDVIGAAAAASVATAAAEPLTAGIPLAQPPRDPISPVPTLGAAPPSSAVFEEAGAAPPVPTSSPVPPPAPTTPGVAPPPEAPDLSAFTPQAGLLAGRVVAPRTHTETLVETAVGTLALPQGEAQIAVGSAVHLRVVAVARPAAVATAPQMADPAVAGTGVTASVEATAVVPPTALQQALAVLATLQPNLAKAATDAFVLEPGARLAALIFGFLAAVHSGAPKRWTESPARAALDALDHGDLRETLDGEAAAIGSQTLPADPTDWKVTVLPYLGIESQQPARLYQRLAEARVEADGSAPSAPGQRFVVEIELRRLGPLQFDGLVRERRFDLAVRTTQALEPELQAEIGHIFRETIGISGYAGDLVFGRLGRFPLLQTPLPAGAHEISA